MFPFLPRQPLNVHDLFGSCTKGDCPQPPNQHTWSECLVVVGLNKFRIRFGPHPRSAKHPKCPKPEQTYQAPARVPNGLRCLWGVQYTHLEVVDSFFQVPTCIGNRAILSIWGPLEAPSGSSSETPPVRRRCPFFMPSSDSTDGWGSGGGSGLGFRRKETRYERKTEKRPSESPSFWGVNMFIRVSCQSGTALPHASPCAWRTSFRESPSRIEAKGFSERNVLVAPAARRDMVPRR